MPAVPSTARLFKSLPPPAGPWLASPLPFGSSSPSTGSRRRSLRSNNLRNQITRTSRILHSC
ncbi:hypothetical protein PVAP13_3NG150902 [Panicum virgatum]|uniref:Uncharacterized protein n=1 Tax=Panicum virgatum TaxID=38727 RepID=A0A8T0UCW3_PANVG|nr:hypothetical protein PVAP13_3NG150902 [Panicum virgatum]KAG2620147.1 hypothetical protein PVAP13_3NG150902 [Panicum virgatum]